MTWDRDRRNAYMREWNKKNPRKRQRIDQRKYRTRLLKKFNLTNEDVARATNCKICERVLDQTNLVFDHNHSTGQFRGFICRYCNSALGLLGECATVCRNAAAYLEANV